MADTVLQIKDGPVDFCRSTQLLNIDISLFIDFIRIQERKEIDYRKF